MANPYVSGYVIISETGSAHAIKIEQRNKFSYRPLPSKVVREAARSSELSLT